MYKLLLLLRSPYVFGGVVLFYFDLYVMDSGRKIFLKPLSTEGQALSEYPDRKAYSLTQLHFRLALVFKYIYNKDIMLSFEIGWRRTNTDYLDDVSSCYVEASSLLHPKGHKAVQLSYRGDEVKGSSTAYPDNGSPLKDIQSGSQKFNDWYYYTGFIFFTG